MKAIQKKGFGFAPRSKEQKVEKLIDWWKIRAIIQKNFIVLTRDKTRLIPLLAFPMIMMLVLGYTSGNTPKHIDAAIVSYDGSPLAMELEQAISGSQYFAVKYIVSTEGEARNLLDSGKIRVIIEIPPGLDDTVNSGEQGVITVIVDESDSSVAGTSRQVLRTIVDSVANRVSYQKLSGYQQSIGFAGEQINEYTASFLNKYPELAEQTSNVDSLITSSKGLINYQIATLLANPIAPARRNIGAGTTVTYNGEEFYFANETGFVLEATSNEKLVAQANILEKSVVFLDKAQQINAQANEISQQAAQDTQNQQSTIYAQKIAKSLSSIQIFSHAKTKNILQPITYAEKPAYGTGRRVTDFLIPSLIAMTIFQGAVMGMGRAVAGEKRDGSLTRVFLTPTSNTTIIVGTLLFYVVFEMVRASFLIGIAVILFDLKVVGSYFLIGLILAVYISISTAIGMIMSSVVKTEQQFMAMAMLVSLPTMFLSGVFFPVQAMPKAFQAIAALLPITYASEGLRNVMVKGLSFASITYPLGILVIFLVITYAGVAYFFKRDVE